VKISKFCMFIIVLAILLPSIASCSNTTSTNTTPTVVFSTYTDNTNLYSISYPQTWELANSMTTLQGQITATISKINAGTPLTTGSVIFVAGLKADVGYYPNINISVDPAPTDLTNNDQAIQAEVNGIKALHPDYQEIARTKIIVNSKTVWLLEFKATFTNTPLMHDYMFVYLLNGNIWTLTCTATDTDFTQFKSEFTVIINSLKINK
jgi:hypothetical protein